MWGSLGGDKMGEIVMWGSLIRMVREELGCYEVGYRVMVESDIILVAGPLDIEALLE